MQRLWSLIRNKYLLAALAFLVWMLFFDRNDFATQYNYQKQKANLESERSFYLKENAAIIKTINDIRSNPQEVQRIAREKYKMKKDNEDIYVITKVAAKENH
ncbi:septum formation initiator family protein [Sphingobacterium siyangense]|uniref:FtsB family cell division protein n=1 Tax=Sphingobacterium siyangense TaxID=459529 RepID=UPI002FDB4970